MDHVMGDLEGVSVLKCLHLITGYLHRHNRINLHWFIYGFLAPSSAKTVVTLSKVIADLENTSYRNFIDRSMCGAVQTLRLEIKTHSNRKYFIKKHTIALQRHDSL